MNSELATIQHASREWLVDYLESYGFAVYRHESVDVLRAAAISNWETESTYSHIND